LTLFCRRWQRDERPNSGAIGHGSHARIDSLSKKKERVRKVKRHQEWRSHGRRRAGPSGGALGEVLVRVAYSCISVGTELSGLQATSEPTWKRAARRPDKVLKVFCMLFTRGFDETVNIVRGQIGAGSVLGCSAAGTVVGLGAGASRTSTWAPGWPAPGAGGAPFGGGPRAAQSCGADSRRGHNRGRSDHELAALGEALTSGGAWPIPLSQQIQATEIACAVENAVSGAGKP